MAFGNHDAEQKSISMIPSDMKWYQRFDWDKVLYAVWILLGCYLLFGFYQQHKYHQELRQLNIIQMQWGKRSDAAQARIAHGVLVPSKVAGNLTKQEGKTVGFLTQLFSDSLTYDDGASYNQARRDAKRYISDPAFFKDFFTTAADPDGKNVVDIAGFAGATNEVNVYPLGGTHYLVNAVYTPYHDHSDLNQKKQLTSLNYVFDVNATYGKVTSCKLMHEFSTEANEQIG